MEGFSAGGLSLGERLKVFQSRLGPHLRTNKNELPRLSCACVCAQEYGISIVYAWGGTQWQGRHGRSQSEREREGIYCQSPSLVTYPLSFISSNVPKGIWKCDNPGARSGARERGRCCWTMVIQQSPPCPFPTCLLFFAVGYTPTTARGTNWHRPLSAHLLNLPPHPLFVKGTQGRNYQSSQRKWCIFVVLEPDKATYTPTPFPPLRR